MPYPSSSSTSPAIFTALAMGIPVLEEGGIKVLLELLMPAQAESSIRIHPIVTIGFIQVLTDGSLSFMPFSFLSHREVKYSRGMELHRYMTAL